MKKSIFLPQQLYYMVRFNILGDCSIFRGYQVLRLPIQPLPLSLKHLEGVTTRGWSSTVTDYRWEGKGVTLIHGLWCLGYLVAHWRGKVYLQPHIVTTWNSSNNFVFEEILFGFQ